ncbi:MAG: arginase [Cytophagaceae bacterium]|jgi:arginase|nr:arginase [Cytophagaceae bacterium]
MKKKPTVVLQVPSDLGAQRLGTSLALDALWVADVERPHKRSISQLTTHRVNYNFIPERGHSGPYAQGKYIEWLSQYNQATAKLVEDHLAQPYPLVISGDHSNAVGIMSGIRSFFGSSKKIGVLWIDAHADMHTPYTTPSGNLHGMTLSALMGFDNIELSRNDVDPNLLPYWDDLKKCGRLSDVPKIHPEDITFIGLRDFEIQEYHLIRDHQLKHYSPYDIKAKGLSVILEQVKAYYADYDAVYVSFDVDVLDTSISTGTGTPVYNGLKMEEAVEVVRSLSRLHNICLWEFTEINPLLDNTNSMAKAVIDLLDVLFEG